MRASKAKRLRAFIEALAEHLEDEEALEGVELFPAWNGAAVYEKNRRVRYKGQLYRCLLGHQAQYGWTPEAAPSLWARVLIEDPDRVREWVQPDSTNPYMKGDRVKHKDLIWVSMVDNNIWEPGIYGWEEAA